MTKTSFAEKLARLKSLFLAQMQEDMPLLDANHKKLLASWEAALQPNPEVLQEMYHLLHKIKGSAGTFGYAELSESALQLETRIKAWEKGGAASQDDQNRYLRDYHTLITLHQTLQATALPE